MKCIATEIRQQGMIMRHELVSGSSSGRLQLLPLPLSAMLCIAADKGPRVDDSCFSPSTFARLCTIGAKREGVNSAAMHQTHVLLLTIRPPLYRYYCYALPPSLGSARAAQTPKRKNNNKDIGKKDAGRDVSSLPARWRYQDGRHGCPSAGVRVRVLLSFQQPTLHTFTTDQ